MRLESDSQAVELRPIRYQFPDRAAAEDGFDWDANWLQVSGDVRDADLVWHFEDPCLTTREARELRDWLRRVADGEVLADGKSGNGWLWFTEPNVHFSLRERSGDVAIMVVSFGQESSPPGAEDVLRYGDGHGVVLRVSATALHRAADDFERELMPFPER